MTSFNQNYDRVAEERRARRHRPALQGGEYVCDICGRNIYIGYSLKSAAEFIDILRTSDPDEDIASLDVESLFTHVPAQETIEIFLDCVYRSGRTPLLIPERLLKEMLEACTMEAPFLSHRGELFRQAFTWVFLKALELGRVLKNGVHFFKLHPTPGLYTRYIDDIFITTSNDEDANSLMMALQNNSCLTFTCEQSDQRRLPFLDLDITKDEVGFRTKVYTKATNVERCLNARGECPTAYKRSVAAAYIYQQGPNPLQ
ncbi:uncharacterized protein LOC143024095 [Oratosquilla oratoria]|uniref:uncharacterized protein LOC143024095 n=1 Tax=Oratosquilla oratoria TaxID=337810 RepID=UPI003F771B39